MQGAVGQDGTNGKAVGLPAAEELLGSGGELYLHLFRVARSSAVRLGLPDREVEDCAIEFVTRMLHHRRRERWPKDADPGRDAWFRECADNWARSVRRRLARISCREVVWTETLTVDRGALKEDLHSGEAGPEARLLEKELHRRIREAVERLTPTQQELFDAYFCVGESIPELVNRTGRSPQAIRRALSTIRQRLRAVLERQAMDETEARDYLCATRAAPALRLPVLSEEAG